MNELAKQTAAERAVEYIKDQCVVGVGTGSTVKPFILALNKCVVEKGLKLKAVATSFESEKALHPSIEILDESLNCPIDISVDGADKASRDFYLIKGGGGALLREKFVALNSKLNITIIDETKIASPLKDHPLPIEIVPFGFRSTIKRLNEAGFFGSLRQNNGNTFSTDNDNYIFDIELKKPIDNPEKTHNSLITITGVIETGLFLQTSDIIIIGKNDRSIDVWKQG